MSQKSRLFCQKYLMIRFIVMLIIISVLISSKEYLYTINYTLYLQPEPNNQLNYRSSIPSKPFKFYVYQNYSKSIKTYFSNCNISSKYGEKTWKNKYSHLGETYFDYNVLKYHKWYTTNITNAQIIILPIFLTMAYHRYCGTKSSGFHSIVKAFFQDLTIFYQHHLFLNKSYLLIASDPYISSLRKPLKMLQFANQIAKNKLIIGHFEDRWSNFTETMSSYKTHGFKIYSFWTQWANATKNTVVIPYTIPFKYKDYKMYDDMIYAINDFHNRNFSLFYMGSACNADIRFPYLMKWRAYGIKYIDILNKEENNNNHIGIVSDYDNSKESNCVKYSDIDVNVIKKCVEDEMHSIIPKQLPCGLTKYEKKIFNVNNRLYVYGLRNSKYNLMIRGDTPSSAKFYDAIAFNLINIMIGITKENSVKFLPFTDIIPYEKFVFF
eukprot:343424_1